MLEHIKGLSGPLSEIFYETKHVCEVVLNVYLEIMNFPFPSSFRFKKKLHESEGGKYNFYIHLNVYG